MTWAGRQVGWLRMGRQSIRRRRMALDGCQVLQTRRPEFFGGQIEALVEHPDLPPVAGEVVPVYRRELLDDGRLVFERVE